MPILVAVVLIFVLSLPIHSARAAEVKFSIADQTDPSEIEEATEIFINGQLAARFTLNAQHPFEALSVSVPEARRYDYAMCGRIKIRRPDGGTETHVLDHGATLADVAGMNFEALAAQDFTTFYLADVQAGNASPPDDVHRTHVCSIPTS